MMNRGDTVNELFVVLNELFVVLNELLHYCLIRTTKHEARVSYSYYLYYLSD